MPSFYAAVVVGFSAVLSKLALWNVAIQKCIGRGRLLDEATQINFSLLWVTQKCLVLNICWPICCELISEKQWWRGIQSSGLAQWQNAMWLWWHWCMLGQIESHGPALLPVSNWIEYMCIGTWLMVSYWRIPFTVCEEKLSTRSCRGKVWWNHYGTASISYLFLRYELSVSKWWSGGDSCLTCLTQPDM